MFKIKLLILLLVSLYISNCAYNQSQSDQKYRLNYISGDYDGLYLSNNLKNHLIADNILDKNSKLSINASINHSKKLYVTNIDNTSDRENILSKLKIQVHNDKKNCLIFDKEYKVEQFYLLASSDKFSSNVIAEKEIKERNTIQLIRKFKFDLGFLDLECSDG